MIDEKEQLEQFLDRYDDLAVMVTEDQRANEAHGVPLSNMEMTEVICETMDWDGFDLFANTDFDHYYKEEDVDVVRAICFLAFLRMDLFYAAARQGIGDQTFNKMAATHSEYWYKKMLDRFNALYTNKTTSEHKWLH